MASTCALDRIEPTCKIPAILPENAVEPARYGYRRITVKLRDAGWSVGKDRVERLWRREGLKVPQKQKPRGRLWLNDGSCVRLRPEQRNHVWSYDFVSTFTHDGGTVRMLNLIDEFTRECLAIPLRGRINSSLIEVLADAMIGTASQSTFVPTTVQSLLRRICASGWRTLEPKHCTSSPALPGRTAPVRASSQS
jgi:transposase InsO family protein